MKPIQLNLDVPGDCGSAAHAIRSVIEAETALDFGNLVIVKLEMKNAFNPIRQDHILEECLRKIPSAHPLAHMVYASPSRLQTSENSIASRFGVQWGDLMGPLLLTLGVDLSVHFTNSPINVWYLDGATIGGPPISVINGLEYNILKLSKIDLEVIPLECELINASCMEEKFTEFHT